MNTFHSYLNSSRRRASALVIFDCILVGGVALFLATPSVGEYFSPTADFLRLGVAAAILVILQAGVHLSELSERGATRTYSIAQAAILIGRIILLTALFKSRPLFAISSPAISPDAAHVLEFAVHVGLIAALAITGIKLARAIGILCATRIGSRA